MVLLSIGLARPQTNQGIESETSRGRNVLLALDLSRSMLVSDLKPDRLTQAKTLCYDLIEALPADRIGVIGFAGEPYLIAPLTPDHANVRETIDQVDTDYIPIGGSNLEGALELAIKTLKETGQKENALILLTDGEETTGRMMELAAEAKRAGVYVFTIAVGTEQGDYIPTRTTPTTATATAPAISSAARSMPRPSRSSPRKPAAVSRWPPPPPASPTWSPSRSPIWNSSKLPAANARSRSNTTSGSCFRAS